jgi:hypothetical protein
MKTLTVDDHQRIRIPEAKPNQVFVCEPQGTGSILLIPVNSDQPEVFPRGSLSKYFTPERDEAETAIASGCVQCPE